MSRGRFITVEGGEGAGKSTQARRLKDELERTGREVLLVREPGGTRLGELIRPLLKDEREDPPCDRAELLLFLAARAQLARNVIAPALERGAWVVSDRFSDSTFAYQGCGRGLPRDVLQVADAFARDGVVPDLTLLLDVPPDVAEARMRRRESATGAAADRIETAGRDFHARLRDGFLEIARREPQRVAVIDASPDAETVWCSIRSVLAARGMLQDQEA